MRAVTVLMTTDVSGGVWTLALDLARGLCASGTNVVLAALGGPLRSAQRLDAARTRGLILADCPWLVGHDADGTAAAAWLQALAADCAPDVVHLHGMAHAGLRFPAPVVVTMHASPASWFRDVRRAPLPASWHRHEQTVKQGLACARVIVASTRVMALNLLRDYAPVAPVLVVANGRDRSACRPAVKEPFVFTSGRLSDEARNSVAVAAIAPHLSWPIYAAGEGSEGLAGVHGLGFLPTPDLAAWLGRASIFVLPATHEPFGLSVLEAALSGCALVLGDIPSLRETWDGAACFVDPASPAALAAAVQLLISDEPRRLDLQARAAAHAQRYSAAVMTSAYLAIYEQLVGVPLAVPPSGRGHTACSPVDIEA